VVAVDPVASLRITGVDLRLAGHYFHIGKHSAADWLEAVIDGTLYQILPGWIDDDDQAERLGTLMLDGELSEDEVRSATLDAVTVAGGRKHWWIFNLLGVAVSNNTAWATLNGRLVQAGVDSERISLAAYVDALYAICVENMDKDQRIQFDTHVDSPPPEEPIDEVEEGEAFLALMATM